MDKQKLVALVEASALAALAVAILKAQVLFGDGSLSTADWVEVAKTFGGAFFLKLLPTNITGKGEA